MRPLLLPPKATVPSSHSSVDPKRADSDDSTTALRPLKISVVFDEDASARSAEILIRRAASDFEYKLQSFTFNELDSPGPGVATARDVSDTDILVVAVRDGRDLPGHVQLWLGLCLGLRHKDQAGLLVALIVKRGKTADSDSSLVHYLKTVAAIGGMTFLTPLLSFRRVSTLNRMPLAPW